MAREQILEVKHYTNRLFSFKTTRRTPWKNNFESGQFTAVSLDAVPNTVRAYSVASAPKTPELEFLSIKIDSGSFTSNLKNIQPGDYINISDETEGRLILKNLIPGRILWLLATGTGLAPFLSLGRNSDTHTQFDRVIVTHTVQTNNELVFRKELEDAGCEVFQTVMNEETEQHVGRISDYIYNGHLFDYFGLTEFNNERDRIMLCGSYEADKEIQNTFSAESWTHSSIEKPGHLIRESAWTGD